MLSPADPKPPDLPGGSRRSCARGWVRELPKDAENPCTHSWRIGDVKKLKSDCKHVCNPASTCQRYRVAHRRASEAQKASACTGNTRAFTECCGRLEDTCKRPQTTGKRHTHFLEVEDRTQESHRGPESTHNICIDAITTTQTAEDINIAQNKAKLPNLPNSWYTNS